MSQQLQENQNQTSPDVNHGNQLIEELERFSCLVNIVYDYKITKLIKDFDERNIRTNVVE